MAEQLRQSYSNENKNTAVAVLLPVYNDWIAVSQLIPLLDRAFAPVGADLHLLIVDDGSTEVSSLVLNGSEKFSAVVEITVVHLMCNVGHQRAIAVGLAQINSNYSCEYALVMDSDGEDRPEDAVDMFESARSKPNFAGAIVAQRTRRSEGVVFKTAYQAYKVLFHALSGQRIDFGNFSLLSRSAVNRLTHSADLWNHFPASILKSRLSIERVRTSRGVRLAGRSSMNLVSLVALGLSAMSVYTDRVFVRILLASLALSGVAAVGLIVVVLIKLLSGLAIPGWATSAAGFLAVILIQSLTFSAIAAFLNLSTRSNAFTVPAMDAFRYVERTCRIDMASKEIES